MAARIKERFGLDVDLIKGSGGQFEVEVDGRLIFSKKELGRFPEDEEILDQLSG